MAPVDFAQLIRKELGEARDSLDRLLDDPVVLCAVDAACRRLVQALRTGRKVLACGNGGSMSQAMHFAAELTGRYRDSRQPLAAIPLADPVHLSCVGNDYSFSDTFSRQVRAFGARGDVLLALSTSGNSPNVLAAARTARGAGMCVIALTGRGGGALGPAADIEIRVPESRYADRAQEMHLVILHVLTAATETGLALEND
ncbi:MAG TPA: SIS domain-containing protein [Gemmatimonadales bacterium]|nr:SIS domain-containing protein [Gemmatimonadales bacterium]